MLFCCRPQHFAKVNAQDEEGCNAYSHAGAKKMEEFLKQQGCTELLLKPVLASKTKFSLNESGMISRRSHLSSHHQSQHIRPSASSASASSSVLTPADMFDHMPASII